MNNANPEIIPVEFEFDTEGVNTFKIGIPLQSGLLHTANRFDIREMYNFNKMNFREYETNLDGVMMLIKRSTGGSTLECKISNLDGMFSIPLLSFEKLVNELSSNMTPPDSRSSSAVASLNSSRRSSSSDEYGL